MWLSGNLRLTIGSIIVITGIAGALLATAKNSQGPVGTSKQPGGLGTVEEAFDAASIVVQQYISAHEVGTAVIDPEYQSTLLSKSKIWTIKGHASCPYSDKVYEWTVIMNYHDMQDWEVLAKTITPLADH